MQISHLDPINSPLPTAKQMPTILNAGFLSPTLSPADWDAEAVALADIVADVDMIGVCGVCCRRLLGYGLELRRSTIPNVDDRCDRYPPRAATLCLPCLETIDPQIRES